MSSSVPASNARTAWLIFGVVLCSTVLCASRAPFWGDARLSLTAAQSWIERGAPTIDDVVRNDVTASPDGHRYSKYGLLLTLACVPAALVIAGPLHGTAAAVLIALPPAIFGALCAVILYLLARRLASDRDAMLLSLALYFGSPLWIYARAYYGEAPQACLMAGLVYAWLRASEAQAGARRGLVVGLLVGISLLSKPTFALLLPFLGLGLLLGDRDRRWRARAIGLFAAGLLPGIALFAWYNQLRYGSPLSLGYGGERDGSLGFSVPLWSGLYSLLLSSGKSVFLYCPLVLLSLFAARRAWARDRALVAATAVPATLWLLVSASWWAWSGDWGWGPRLLVPVIPLVGLLVAGDLEDRGRARLVWAAGLLGFGINALGVLVHYAAYLSLLAPFRKLLHAAGDAAAMRDDLMLPHYVPELSPIVGHAWMLRCYVTGAPLADSFPWQSHALAGVTPPATVPERLDLIFASSPAGAMMLLVAVFALVAVALRLGRRS